FDDLVLADAHAVIGSVVRIVDNLALDLADEGAWFVPAPRDNAFSDARRGDSHGSVAGRASGSATPRCFLVHRQVPLRSEPTELGKKSRTVVGGRLRRPPTRAYPRKQLSDTQPGRSVLCLHQPRRQYVLAAKHPLDQLQ